ncbi:MAG: DUF3466 family protein, partial [Opitutales bacterium]
MHSNTRLRLLLLLAAALPLATRLRADDISHQYEGSYGAYPALSAYAFEIFHNLKYVEASQQTGSGSNTAVHACFFGLPVPLPSTPPKPTTLSSAGGQSQIQGANANGVAVGTAQTSSSTTAPYHACSWTPPASLSSTSFKPATTSTTWTFTAFESLPGTTTSVANGINAGGVAVGVDYTSNAQDAVMWDANGNISDLNDLDNNSTLKLMQANAINDSGQIVGEAQDVNGFTAFLYENGTDTDLGSLGGGGSQAYGINNSGQIVGQSNTADSQTHAFLYENGNMTDLG